MRWTRTLVPTLKEQPAEAEIPSHRLMLRAGLIRKLAAGAYTYLPLGLRSLRKAADIVRQEMDAAGGVEVLMPILQPLELWEQTGRAADYGPELVRLNDRNGRRFALGPTHEEVVTTLVRDHVQSHKQLPITLYQIHTKFRDEVRPRFGVLRSREFLMKDAYSFDLDLDGLERSYRTMYRAYCRIFDRCGLEYVAVEAESGPIGGDASHEFMVPCDTGEDLLVRCTACNYAANRERADVGPQAPAGPIGTELGPLREVSTPDQRTIEDVSAFLGCTPQVMVKTLIYKADGKPVAALVRGDHELNEAKLARALGAEAVELADPDTIQDATGAPVGFAGPVGLRIPMVVDRAVALIRNGVTGANKADAHLTGVNPGRDFHPDHQADIRFADDGDPCPRCSSTLASSRGIELGHVFKLGTVYSEKLGATVLDERNREQPMVMGCYGIGINRILAAVIETSHDEAGIVWPQAVAPYRVLIVSLNTGNAQVAGVAEDLYKALEARGVDVLLDDRDARPGFKFKDADLVGFPVRAVVGERRVKEGAVEVARRDDGVKNVVPIDRAAEAILGMLD